MTTTTLDPVTALIVVDLQKGLAGFPLATPFAEVTAHAGELAAAFRDRGLPVVLVTAVAVPPGRTEYTRGPREFPADFAELVPELDRQPQDVLVTKRTPGAFTATGLEGELRRRGATQVVVCGVATSIGVEGTARQAYELGFNVTFALDAMADLSAEAHAGSVERIFPRLGVRAATADIVAALRSRPRS